MNRRGFMKMLGLLPMARLIEPPKPMVLIPEVMPFEGAPNLVLPEQIYGMSIIQTVEHINAQEYVTKTTQHMLNSMNLIDQSRIRDHLKFLLDEED